MKISLILIIIALVVSVLIIVLILPKKKIRVEGPGLKTEVIIEEGLQRKNEVIKNYDNYIMNTQEKVVNILLAAFFIFVTGLIFYRSIFFSLMITPFALFYPKIRKKAIIKERRKTLTLQFKDALYSISSSLSAGKSVENAFVDTLKDQQILHLQKDTYIIIELKHILAKVAMNQTIEETLEDFAKRSKIEDIKDFADVFIICKRTGGNLIDAIKNSSKIISEKIEFRQELNNLLAQKKFEQKLLSIIPVLLILTLSWAASDYMDPIFATPAGKIVMTIALILISVGHAISKKIIDIEV
ncbi:MAG: type II secretion system F family protein [Alkaliphilus sp.]